MVMNSSMGALLAATVGVCQKHQCHASLVFRGPAWSYDSVDSSVFGKTEIFAKLSPSLMDETLCSFLAKSHYFFARGTGDPSLTHFLSAMGSGLSLCA